MPAERLVKEETPFGDGEKNAEAHDTKRKKTSGRAKEEVECPPIPTKKSSAAHSNKPERREHPEARFLGAPIKKEEASRRWPYQYSKKKDKKPKVLPILGFSNFLLHFALGLLLAFLIP